MLLSSLMAPSFLLLSHVLILFVLVHASEDLRGNMREVKVKAGEEVTLECQGPTHAPIEVLKWIRPDLMSDRGLEGYVFFYRDERSHESYHHQLFVGRVELRDPEMKDGDVSLILRNVSTNDTGRYEGHVSVSNTGRRKRAQSELWCVIKLTVEDSGPTHEETWFRQIAQVLGLEENHLLYVLVSVAVVVILLTGLCCSVIKKYKNRSQNYGPSMREPEEMAMKAQDSHSCDSPSHC
ncbi:uncharacterized protein LOC108887058 [Lates calcarifer]|uniref:Uncharacterized protein LOC108887058 n=1 Tax=Lates calcarifer TaxID=8187 RepID=A0AAJ7PSV7_LATCA|nr:uncharacterized protein LOC108887058 [Lates calcarifer]